MGTGTIANFDKKFRSFKEARKFVRSLKLSSETQWRLYNKGELQGKPKKPDDIPTNPNNTYKDQGWIGMPDWLGTKTKPKRKKVSKNN